MSHAISKIPAVAAKQAADDNTVSVEVQKLNIESAELTKTITALPNGHPSLTAANARKAVINARLAAIGSTQD